MNLVIISTNRDKYSETFIHNHVKYLPFKIHFLFDGYLPRKYSDDRGLSAFSIFNFAESRWSFFGVRKKLNSQQKLILGIENYLRERKIDIVLCEYGPSGVEMMPFAKKLNIPLIVHFHGYDAYRDDVLRSYGLKYKELFSEMTFAIVVSRHMQEQLLKLGCEQKKIQTLCYGIDTVIFQSKNNKRNVGVFIACGRFVDKKAPYLTIRAFEKVYKKNSDVKLIMIGDGELFQSCKELTETLKIDDAVDFKGVLKHDEISELYSQSFAFVQHSITTAQNDSEGTPLAILEAMCAGLPIISTKHGGIVDVVNEAKTGFLIEEGDVDAMAEKMEFLFHHPEIAEQMGQNAAGVVNREYNLDIYMERLAEVLKQSKK